MSSTRISLLFSFAEKYLLLIVATAASMVVARLLTPEETGIYSIGSMLVGLAHVLRDFGVGQYVVQARELDTAALRAVLGTSYLLAAGLAVLIALLSEPLAAFYAEPRLVTVLQLLAVNFVLIPASSVTLALLRRQMRFGAVCAVNVIYGLTGALAAAGLAWYGAGYMSLAWATLSASVAGLLASLAVRPAELPWLPSLRGMRKVLGFGAVSTAGTVVDEAAVSTPDLVIGKLIGMEGAGLFGKAQSVLAVFRNVVMAAVTPVLLPLYAERERSGGCPNTAYLTTVTYLTACAWPFFAVVAVATLPVVRVLYGDQWDGAVPLIRVLCVSAALYSMGGVSRYLFVATGHVKLQARLDVLAALVRIAAVAAGALGGLAGAAWAVSGSAMFRTWLTCRY
ncbi:lipopolysaccharide biosynthesis protein, partial [Massilia arenosa]